MLKSTTLTLIAAALYCLTFTTLQAFITDHMCEHVNSAKTCETVQTKQPIVSTEQQLHRAVDDYIKTKNPKSRLSTHALIDACHRYDVSLVFVLAQATIESNIGRDGLAKRTNSVWNVGSFDGHGYVQIGKIYKYPTVNHSIEPYLKTLTKYYLKDKTERDLLLDFSRRDGRRYATDVDYERKLWTVIGQIERTTDISRLYNVYRNDLLKRKLGRNDDVFTGVNHLR